MMKKLVGLLFAVVFFAPAAFAGWGVGVYGGIGSNDPKLLQAAYDNSGGNKELDKNPVYGGIEGLYEWTLNDEANKFGLKLGLEGWGENEMERKSPWYQDITENTVFIPLTAYYKRDNGIKAWSFYGGAGVTYSYTEMEAKGLANEKEHKSKLFPHIAAGAEYRFCKLFALGFEAKYNFAAKMKKDGVTWTDHSGLAGAITGRFYF